MNDRQRAIEILRRARRILVRRLSRQIVELEDEILDDARGESYLSEIADLHEQLGARLAHVTQMLAGLTAREPSTTARDQTKPAAPDSQPMVSTPRFTARDFAPDVLLGLPAPKPSESPEAPLSFQAFINKLKTGDLNAAGAELAVMFGLPHQRALRCAAAFARGLREEPELMLQAVELRSALSAGGFNDALFLLHKCFGLSGVESLAVVRRLRGRLGAK